MITEYNILKNEEEISTKLWDDMYKHCTSPTMDINDYDMSKRYLNHEHMCDFRILYGSDYDWECNTHKWRIKKFFRKLFHLPDKENTMHYHCKKYLDSIGEKQDECWECCDRCIHMKYVTISGKTDGLILNISTSGIDNPYLKEHGYDLHGVDKLKEDICTK